MNIFHTAQTQFFLARNDAHTNKLIQKLKKPELSFLFGANLLYMILPPVKFHEYIPYGLGVMS